ncbi:MMPL family transporter [Nocardia farcinica]|uniref:MMPL family transporter n=1 Tax=Nocardia farcinica TaxID=37329 RepID=UPI0024550411|nr:MMPL family transporter [Nocardia farcinica]
MDDVNPWDRLAAVVTGRRSWLVLLALLLASGALLGLVGANDSAGQAPTSLPDSAESAQVQRLLRDYPGGDVATAIVVLDRPDGAELTEDQVAAASAAVAGLRTDAGAAPDRLTVSEDRKVALGQVPVPGEFNGTALTDEIERLRTLAGEAVPAGLRAQITGGPAFGADIADSFAGADVTLLVVTALVVALLLMLTYRSPVLWLVPLLVVGYADRVAAGVGVGLARVTGLTFDGSTAGITSVLVFGAGTNYALLLISRYRDELHGAEDHRAALRAAVRRCAPAIVASNVTVVLALLTLLLATLPNTRSLGLLAAAGLVVAAVFVLIALPPALALCGRRVFWPFVPRVDGRDVAGSGVWYRIAAAVVRRPLPIAAATLGALLVCATGLFGADVGLAQADQFRVRAESVDALDTVAAHFPSGASDPTVVLARAEAAAGVQAALDGTDGVSRAMRTGPAHDGLARWTVVLDAAPASAESFDTIRALRTQLDRVPGAEALVGGSDAKELDTAEAARGDQLLVIPLILAVVFLVLLALLRALPAAVLLIGVTVLSALAALGLGSLVSQHIFGFPALDTTVPLFGFLFLVALGVDYTIFLVTRAREEAPEYGTATGIVRAVSATGPVITSAGIVLAAVFCVLGVLPLITLTQLGIVVGIGIVLDTFVVRTVVVPALFALVGARVWWPSRLDARTDTGDVPAQRAGIR